MSDYESPEPLVLDSPLFQYQAHSHEVGKPTFHYIDAIRAVLHAHIGLLVRGMLLSQKSHQNEFDQQYNGTEGDIMDFLQRKPMVVDLTSFALADFVYGEPFLEEMIKEELEAWGFRTGIYGVRPAVIEKRKRRRPDYLKYIVVFKSPLYD